jgi:hypothetical protein
MQRADRLCLVYSEENDIVVVVVVVVFTWSRDSSGGKAAVYGLNGRGLFPGRGKTLFSSPQCPGRLQGSPSLLSIGYRRGQSGRGVKLIIHLHLLPRSRCLIK